PFDIEGTPFELNASAGLSLSPLHGLDVEILLQRAEVAMSIAKQRRSGCEVYRHEDNQYTRRRLTLFGELGPALRDHQLFVHYQPKAEMRTGRVTSVEALLRWDHPTFGRVPPEEFIPLAERTGLVRKVTEYV